MAVTRISFVNGLSTAEPSAHVYGNSVTGYSGARWRLAGESDDVGWWMSFSDTIPDWFATYVDLESDADQIRIYTSELVDGLLQTTEYAEAVARAAFPNITDDDLRRSIELRTGRQAQLDREHPADLHVVMSEAPWEPTPG